MVATSLPIMEKITVGIAANTMPMPSGNSPPCASNVVWIAPSPGPNPTIHPAPSKMNPVIVNTFNAANQNSNSP